MTTKNPLANEIREYNNHLANYNRETPCKRNHLANDNRDKEPMKNHKAQMTK